MESLANYTSRMHESLSSLNSSISILHEKRQLWLQEKRRNALGFPMSTKIEELEHLASSIVDGLVGFINTQNAVKRNPSYFYPQEQHQAIQNLSAFDQQIDRSVNAFLSNIFLVETNPGLIVHLNTSIKLPNDDQTPEEKHCYIKARLLGGSRMLALGNTSLDKITVGVINEADANAFQEDVSHIPTNFGQMTKGERNASGLGPTTSENWRMGCHPTTAEFRKLQMTKRPTASKQGNNGENSVLGQKYFLYFTTQFSFMGRGLVTLRTLSTGFTATSNPNQDCDAWPFSLWLNAFPKDTEVTPEGLLEVLRKVFGKMTGREPTDENVSYLRQKLLSKSHKGEEKGNWVWKLFHGELLSNCYANGAEYAQETQRLKEQNQNVSHSDKKLKRKKITFAVWFFSLMKLCQSAEYRENSKTPNIHLEWKNGLIEGFGNAKEAEEKLFHANVRQPGTILVRFSDTFLEAVTIIRCEGQGKNQRIRKASPCQPDDLAVIPLARRILENTAFKFIYPAVDKKILPEDLGDFEGKDQLLKVLGYDFKKKIVEEPHKPASQENQSQTEADQRQEILNASASPMHDYQLMDACKSVFDICPDIPRPQGPLRSVSFPTSQNFSSVPAYQYLTAINERIHEHGFELLKL